MEDGRDGWVKGISGPGAVSSADDNFRWRGISAAIDRRKEWGATSQASRDMRRWEAGKSTPMQNQTTAPIGRA